MAVDDKSEMRIHNTTLVEQQQKHMRYYKVHRHEYVRGKETLPMQQNWLIDETKFTHLPFKKALKKRVKTIEKQGQKLTEDTEEQGETSCSLAVFGFER